MRCCVVVPALLTAAAVLAGCAPQAAVRTHPQANRLTAELHPAVIPTSDRRQKSAGRMRVRGEPLPTCALSKPPEDVPASEAGIVMLDYERQCYKQTEAIERA